MPPSADPKVLAIVDRVLARNCSINTAIQEVCGAFADTKSEEAFRRNVRKHVQKRRAANDVAEAAEAEAGTAKHYTKGSPRRPNARRLDTRRPARRSSPCRGPHVDGGPRRPDRRARGGQGGHGSSACYGSGREQRQARHGGRGGARARPTREGGEEALGAGGLQIHPRFRQTKSSARSLVPKTSNTGRFDGHKQEPPAGSQPTSSTNRHRACAQDRGFIYS